MILIDITREESVYLRNNGRGHDIHIASRTHGKRKKSYFVTESYKTMKLLNNYRKQHLSENKGE